MTIAVATRNRREQLLDLLPRRAAPPIVVDDGASATTARAFPGVRVVALGRTRRWPAELDIVGGQLTPPARSRD